MNTLSRLKGIETFGEPRTVSLPCQSLNTLSRLKGIETNGKKQNQYGDFAFSLNTLSRLKGIETKRGSISDNPIIVFEYTFPFEGN